MTDLQLRTLEFIREQLAATGGSPTIAEIDGHLGTRRRANDLVTALVRMGKLTREHGKPRSLQLAGVPDVRLIDDATLRSEAARRGFTMEGLQAPQRLAFGRGAVSCASDCCQVEVPRGHLFCRPHWFDLPESLRTEILAAFRANDAARYGDAVSRARDLIDCGAPA